MATRLDGPRLMPKHGARPETLVVFLHGFGADGDDLIEIGRVWQDVLPTAAFVSPHAPSAHPMGFGRQWFPLTFEDPDERWRGVNAAGPILAGFLDEELARHGLAPERLALVGFSQGTMMALHVGLRRARGPAAIVGYSGALVVPEGQPLDAVAGQLTATPPILLVHGDEDDVIPATALLQSAQALAQLGRPVEWHLAQGLGHGIDEEGLRQGADFLARAFGARR